MKKNVKIIHLENAGENKTLKESCAKTFEEINFEFTSPGIPQRNGIIERVFATTYSWMRVMMPHLGLNENLKTGIWTKCVATATKLENIMINQHKEKCAHCECTEILRKDNYLCTIFTALIVLHVYSRLNGFHNLMVFTVIVFQNTWENIFKRKKVSKSAPL